MRRKLVVALFYVSLCGFALTGCSKETAAPVSVTEEMVSDVTADGAAIDDVEEETEADEVEETEEVVEEVSKEEDSVEEIEESAKASIEDGVYVADFDTDSSMFHINETLDGKGTLTVSDGEMVIHITLAGTGIINLYPGLAEDAQKEGAVLLEASKDEVTYDDGEVELVNGFDLPVPYLDDEFDCALIGKKGVWYDHKVSVSNVVAIENVNEEDNEDSQVIEVEDGQHTAEVVLEGGSGKATVSSPAVIKVEDGKNIAVIEWSSSNYDFMIVDGQKYLPVNTEGNSVFEIPVAEFGVPLEVQADTVAMSKPHLIDYTLTFTMAE